MRSVLLCCRGNNHISCHPSSPSLSLSPAPPLPIRLFNPPSPFFLFIVSLTPVSVLTQIPDSLLPSLFFLSHPHTHTHMPTPTHTHTCTRTYIRAHTSKNVLFKVIPFSQVQSLLKFQCLIQLLMFELLYLKKKKIVFFLCNHFMKYIYFIFLTNNAQIER